MSYILAIADSTAATNNALHYACSLAADLSLPVKLVRSYELPIAASLETSPLPILPIDEMREISEEQVTKLSSSLSATFPSVVLETQVVYGDIQGAIQDVASEIAPLLVVLGNDVANENSILAGGEVMASLRQLPYTIAAIPETAVYKPVQNICLACDFAHLPAHMPVPSLLEWVARTNAKLHVVSVEKEAAEAVVIPSELQQLLSSITPEYHQVTGANVEEGLQHFVEKMEMDWLAVMPQQHGFFEGLFRKSSTKAVAMASSVPVVAFHATT